MKLAKILAIPALALTAMALTLTACNGGKTEAPAAANDTTAVADSAKADSTVAASTYHFRPGKKVEGKLIALTFDDGPNFKATPKVLEVLKKYGAHATFFCVGLDINSSTATMMKRNVEYGNEICSHTYNHPFLSTLSPEEIKEEITKTNEAIKDAVGYYPNFVRPPYIDVDQSVLDCIDVPCVSGIGSDDWMTNHTPEMITAKVLKYARPNAVFMMHDLGANTRTPVALETIVPRLQQMGYKLVTLTDLFTSAGVTPEPHKLYKNPTSTETPPESLTKRARMAKKKGVATDTTANKK